MPSHISVNSLGLTYKGTVGISTATIPDVCKTPTPGGPIPLPYPNIAQQSSLKGGTTTVFAKGKMIAIKGSQYGSSNGDEPGTAGGVKSGVNMKATDWITYSFDVKMDGQNACRHTDKKFHNNQNTVDLGGNIDPRTSTDAEGNLVVQCKGAPKGVSKRTGKKRKAYSNCELEEICAKIAYYNRKIKEANRAGKPIQRTTAYESRRDRGNKACRRIKRYAGQGKGATGTGKPEDMKFHNITPSCEKVLKDKAKKSGFKGFSPDHYREIQHNGDPSATSNLRWMSSKPNKWIGGAMSDLKTSGPNKHTGVKSDCCPPPPTP